MVLNYGFKPQWYQNIQILILMHPKNEIDFGGLKNGSFFQYCDRNSLFFTVAKVVALSLFLCILYIFLYIFSILFNCLMASFLYCSHIVIALPTIIVALSCSQRRSQGIKKERQLCIVGRSKKRSKELMPKMKHRRLKANIL